MSADGRQIHRTQCSTTELCEASLSTSAGAVSWLVSEPAYIGLAWYRGAALFCTHASHIAGRSLAQPRWRRLDRHLLVTVTEPGSAVTAWMGGISCWMRLKIIAPSSCFSLKLLLRDVPSAKRTGLGPTPTK